MFLPLLTAALALGVARASSIQHPADPPQTRATNSSSGLTGDSKCVDLMCIAAVVFPNATTQYTLSSTGSSSLGWIAMGFGAQMANSPMVIVWPNADGSVTLSQRMAPGEVMPTVVASPPRLASLDVGLSSFASSNAKPSFVYTVPSVPATSSQAVIWAFGGTPPDNASPSAPLIQHLDSGTFNLDLTLPIAANATAPPPTAAPTSDDSEHARFMRIVAHGVLCTVGFLGLLPLGVLVARWTRTFTPHWFTSHWVIQSVLSGPIIVAGVALGIHAVDESQSLLSGPIIVAGVALGIHAVDESHGMHLDDTHKKLGIALFVLYFAQLAFGALIHFVRVASAGPARRPPQNYAHAIMGLLILALAGWQVRTGFRTEYPEWTTGRVPMGVETLWIVWVVIIPVAYLAGLALLPRQFRQERARRAGAGGSGSAAGIVRGPEMREGSE
ncbi:hypothetical protein HWV62_10953 [Athelia sp. TMB]|nr:hypothetical protein HWV62_10953 [Athelia sp. TMB]